MNTMTVKGAKCTKGDLGCGLRRWTKLTKFFRVWLEMMIHFESKIYQLELESPPVLTSLRN
jgi:hypothetical protein